MKKINFLIKLRKKEILQVIAPSEEIKEAYLQRANESLSSSKILFKANNLKDSVALAYYSMYHSVLALLFKTGIKCENHAGAIILLKEAFGIDDSAISKAKSERVDKQYYVDFSVNLEEAKKSIKIAEDFINDMSNYIAKLKKEDIVKYRNKIIEMSSD